MACAWGEKVRAMQGTRTRRGCRERFRRCLLLVAGVGERAVHQTTDQQVVPRVRYPWERPMQAVETVSMSYVPVTIIRNTLEGNKGLEWERAA